MRRRYQKRMECQHFLLSRVASKFSRQFLRDTMRLRNAWNIFSCGLFQQTSRRMDDGGSEIREYEIDAENLLSHDKSPEASRSKVHLRHPMVSWIMISIMAISSGAGGPTLIARPGEREGSPHFCCCLVVTYSKTRYRISFDVVQ